jgi:hypothetical protein
VITPRDAESLSEHGGARAVGHAFAEEGEHLDLSWSEVEAVEPGGGGVRRLLGGGEIEASRSRQGFDRLP